MKTFIAFLAVSLIVGSKGNDFDQTNISIETFSDFPNEIDGCSCYFSNNESEFKQKKYIYVNNYANLSFMKVNGKMLRFSLSSEKPNKGKIYENGDYKMQI